VREAWNSGRKGKRYVPGLLGELAEEAQLLVQLIEVIFAATFWIVTKFSFLQPRIISTSCHIPLYRDRALNLATFI
jgi:hypothetical protein